MVLLPDADPEILLRAAGVSLPDTGPRVLYPVEVALALVRVLMWARAE